MNRSKSSASIQFPSNLILTAISPNALIFNTGTPMLCYNEFELRDAAGILNLGPRVYTVGRETPFSDPSTQRPSLALLRETMSTSGYTCSYSQVKNFSVALQRAVVQCAYPAPRPGDTFWECCLRCHSWPARSRVLTGAAAVRSPAQLCAALAESLLAPPAAPATPTPPMSLSASSPLQHDSFTPDLDSFSDMPLETTPNGGDQYAF